MEPASAPSSALRPLGLFAGDFIADFFTADVLAARSSSVSSSSDSSDSDSDSDEDDSPEASSSSSSSSSRRLFAAGLAFDLGLPLARGFGFGPGFALAAVFLGSAAADAADSDAVVANGSLRLVSSLSQNALGALRSRVLLPPLLPPIDAGVPAADLADGVAAAGVVAVATAPGRRPRRRSPSPCVARR